MIQPKILVTGATGKTGGAIVAELLVKNLPVRAVVRQRDARSERLERMGVETVIADLYDPQQMTDALRGTQRAYFVPVFHPYMLQSAAVFAVAAQEAKLESIVQMSQWLSNPAHPSLATRQTWLIDRLFATIPGVAHTIVNPGWFADNALRVLDYAALLGIYPVLTGKSRSAPVSNEDIARVVAAILTDPDRHAGKRYRPTGPKLLSAYEMAAIIEKVVGNRVIPVELPFWMFLRVARLQGVDPFMVSGFRHYVQEHRRGTFELGGGINDVVHELTGSPAESFDTTARRYAEMPFARKTTANRLRALWEFLRVPLSPGYNLDRLDREQLHPVPPHPIFSADSDLWRQDHGIETLEANSKKIISVDALQGVSA